MGRDPNLWLIDTLPIAEWAVSNIDSGKQCVHGRTRIQLGVLRGDPGGKCSVNRLQRRNLLPRNSQEAEWKDL